MRLDKQVMFRYGERQGRRIVLFQEVHLYEMLPGFVVGFLATIGVSLLTKAPEGAAQEIEAVWRAVGHPCGDLSESNRRLTGPDSENNM